MRRGNSRLLSGLAFVGMTFLICSCGEKGATVPQTGATLEGTVKYGDEQVQFALIIATVQGSSATGKIDDEGRYHIDNVPLGEVSIAVNTDAGRGEYMSKSMAAGAYKGPQGGSKAAKVNVKFVEVPKKYHDPSTTTLKTTVNKGTNTYDIKIPK